MSVDQQSYSSNHNNYSSNSSADEWYDQGFDLDNDDTSDANSLDHSINFSLLKSAQQQLKSTTNNLTVSDASVTLRADNGQKLRLNIDKKNNFSSGSTTYNPRTDAIIVGGEIGRINAVPKGQVAGLGAGLTPTFGNQNSYASYESDVNSNQSKFKFNNVQEISSKGSLDTSNQMESDTNTDSDYFDNQNNLQSHHINSAQYNDYEKNKDNFREISRHNIAVHNHTTESRHHYAQYSQDPNFEHKHSFNHYQEEMEHKIISDDEQKTREAFQSVTKTEKPNSEKTLEELAQENQGLSTEALMRLKRSSNRCHLVSRTPIFDANSNVKMYELKFTAGKVFQVNALKSEHVYHVLFGYFIRRGLSCFIGRGKHVLVMMPITYDFLKYIDRFSVNRVILRISPDQEVTPSALHLLTKLHRSGMGFAIDLMLLLKKEWNRAVLSIEYVMIDLSTKVQEQLNVFNRLKIKAPWLKTIGYNDVRGDGYIYLVRNQIDFYDGPFWSRDIKFNQDVELFSSMQNTMLSYIKELFKEKPEYSNFYNFLRSNEKQARDLAVFFYRFRQASPRQIQNIEDLYQYLVNFHPNRSFSVIFGRAILLHYCRAAPLSAQAILQQYYVQALVRGYFIEYINRVFDDNPFVAKYGFQAGMFSLLHLFLLKDEIDVLIDPDFDDINNIIYGENELLSDMIDCVKSLENTNLTEIFNFIRKYQIPPASVIISYEKAIMRTNELLLVLHIVSQHKTE